MSNLKSYRFKTIGLFVKPVMPILGILIFFPAAFHARIDSKMQLAKSGFPSTFKLFNAYLIMMINQPSQKNIILAYPLGHKGIGNSTGHGRRAPNPSLWSGFASRSSAPVIPPHSLTGADSAGKTLLLKHLYNQEWQ
ncbi:MAG: hypothetical protein CTY19_12755 [Methylomonas sp.]|nr:MAG: hypothetical protein CTY19_12755 [Methylomonas sp.]